MNKYTWIIICLILALGVSLLIKDSENQPLLMQAVRYVSTQKTQMLDDNKANDQEITDDTTMNNEDETMNGEDEDTQNEGEVTIKKAAEGYATYNEAIVKDALSNGKKVALFFRASRCPNCVALNGNIETNYKSIPNDTMIYKVDYDTSDDLKEKYGVTSQHTLVFIDDNMNEVNKVLGPTNLDEVLAGFDK